jgi:hypothetical protein
LGPVSLLDLAVPLLLSMALVRAAIYVLRHAFSPSSWLATSERFIATSIWLCLALYLTGLADPLIEMLEQVSFHVGKQKLDLWTLLTGLVTVVVTVLVALWLSGEIEARLLASETLDSNLRVVLGRLVKAVLSVVALLLSLSIVGIDITALSVFSGALAVGLGLGLQKIASNYVSGFIILLDRSIRIGNWWRSTRDLRNRDPDHRPLYGPAHAGRYRGDHSQRVPGVEYRAQRVVHRFTAARAGIGAGGLRHRSRASDAPDDEAAQAQPRVLDRPGAASAADGFCRQRHQSRSRLLDCRPAGGNRWRPFGDQPVDLALVCEHGIEIPFPQREVRLIGYAVSGLSLLAGGIAILVDKKIPRRGCAGLKAHRGDGRQGGSTSYQRSCGFSVACRGLPASSVRRTRASAPAAAITMP